MPLASHFQLVSFAATVLSDTVFGFEHRRPFFSPGSLASPPDGSWDGEVPIFSNISECFSLFHGVTPSYNRKKFQDTPLIRFGTESPPQLLPRLKKGRLVLIPKLITSAIHIPKLWETQLLWGMKQKVSSWILCKSFRHLSAFFMEAQEETFAVSADPHWVLWLCFHFFNKTSENGPWSDFLHLDQASYIHV